MIHPAVEEFYKSTILMFLNGAIIVYEIASFI